MDKHDIANLLYEMLDTECAKQKSTLELFMRQGVVHIRDDEDKDWEISVRQIGQNSGE